MPLTAIKDGVATLAAALNGDGIGTAADPTQGWPAEQGTGSDVSAGEADRIWVDHPPDQVYPWTGHYSWEGR
jgi:hypothetical protein